MQNVYDYFMSKFPDTNVSADDRECLADMPLETPCGEACQKAINAGAAFLLEGVGAFDGEQNADVIAKTGYICCVIIAG